MRYIRLVIEAHLARVPNQLISTDADSGNDEDENLEQELDEFCGIGGGGIVGFNGPLGSDKVEHPMASVGKKRKRK